MIRRTIRLFGRQRASEWLRREHPDLNAPIRMWNDLLKEWELVTQVINGPSYV